MIRALSSFDSLLETPEKFTLCVLKGGPGTEREVSLASAASVSKALRESGFQVVEIDVQGEDFEIPKECLLAYNVIHGTFGEDGQLQAILDEKNIPYTGTDAESSRLAMDKIASKKRFVAKNIPTPDFEIVAQAEDITFSPPFVVKAPSEGSSVGVHLIHSLETLGSAMGDVQKYDSHILVEKFVKGRELTVGILGETALPIIEIKPKGGFYDMKSKYPWLANAGGGSEYLVPAPLDSALAEKIQVIALEAHRALGVSVYSRVDFLLPEVGEPTVLEINTIPGMTESSLLPKAAEAMGIDFQELCLQIIQFSLEKYQ